LLSLSAPPTMIPVETGAEFSPCRRYRYRLWRAWDAALPTCAFIGLNPSTADETRDDPTIRKCIGFARAWGFGRCEVVNLFGWRSTEPGGLLRSRRACCAAGPALDNDRAMAVVMARAPRLVLAWGSHARIRRILEPRERQVCRNVAALARALCALGHAIEIGCLGANADGSPRHPLYLPYATAFLPQGERRAVIGMRNERGRG
jgi:hypothetical protein